MYEADLALVAGDGSEFVKLMSFVWYARAESWMNFGNKKVMIVTRRSLCMTLK